MDVCERCSKEHNGEYGSGRFCSERCARSFVTAARRQEINRKVSQKLWKPRPCTRCGEQVPFGHKFKLCPSCQATPTQKEAWQTMPFEKLGNRIVIKKRLIHDHGHRCWKCNNSEWLGKPITLELEHVDGDNKNNAYDNLQILCPNCHSQTDTWKWRNVFRRRKMGLPPLSNKKNYTENPS